MYEFGIQAVGREAWTKGISSGERYTVMASPYDEAFVLLGVLNMWNKVVFASSLSQEEKENLKDSETHVVRTIDGKPKILGYYTENISQDTRLTKEGSNGKPGGKSWSKEGFEKFRNLKDAIRNMRGDAAKKAAQQRKRSTDFDKMIKEEHAAKLQRDQQNRSSAKKRAREPVAVDVDENILGGMADDDFCDDMIQLAKKQRKFYRA